MNESGFGMNIKLHIFWPMDNTLLPEQKKKYIQCIYHIYIRIVLFLLFLVKGVEYCPSYFFNKVEVL